MRIALLLLAFVLAGTPHAVRAAAGALHSVDLQILRSASGGGVLAHVGLVEPAAIQALVASGAAQVLESARGTATEGQEALLGRINKMPITYVDDRASHTPQVNYVDRGLKLHIRLESAPGGALLADYNLQALSTAEQEAPSEGFTIDNKVLLPPGKGAVVARWQGALSARSLGRVWPKANLTPQDTVAAVITVQPVR